MTGDLPHERGWIGLKKQYIPAHDGIEQSVEFQLCWIPLAKRHSSQASLFSAPRCCGDRRRRYVRADHLAGGADELGGKECDITRTAADVEHAHARVNPRLAKNLSRGRLEETRLHSQARQLSIGVP